MADKITLDDITYGTTGWNGLAQSNFEKIAEFINGLQDGINLLASVEIDCQSLVKQTIYTVPDDVIMIPHCLVIREPSATLAGLIDADFGSGASANTWLQQISLDAFTGITDYGIIAQPDQAAGPPIVPVKKTIEIAAAVWGIKINTGSTGVATVTMELFGYLQDA